MPSASRARADAMSASDIRTAPLLAEAWHRARRGQIVGPRHARPQAGAVRGSGPAASGEFDHACARCRRNARSGRRNRCFDRTKEHGSASIRACRGGRSLDTVTCPIGGETENASHTEILTLPPSTSAPAAAADRTGIGQVASVNRSTYPTIVTSGSTGRPAVGCASSD